MFIEETFSYLGNIVSLGNLMAMLLGVCIGLVIGAIPGLSPPMAIALLIPVSFEFEPATALILLVSCFAAGIYGGSFSAILLRTPGTSASAASAIEGYELTKKGKAVEAIKVSTFASVMGGIISGFVLLFLSRPLAQVSLWFGPAEYFLIALLGLTAIASVSFGSVSKGLISGLLGLCLSTIGVDHFSSYPRFTFDLIGLQAGIGIMPAIIGLFAFAQGLDLCAGEAHGNISGLKSLSWRIWPKLSEMYQIKWSLMRGWACGLVVGIIPAAGGSIAQWIAYAWEIRRAKSGDQFGKGEIKGLAATEGSNNGVTGTSLIPMFVLGIPGGISAAVILGALTIHGLQPGLRLFKNNPEVIYTIMWGFIGANVIMAFVAIVMARTFAYLTLVPRGILGPLIILFSVVGVYAGSNNVYDIWLMIGFGVLGYFMEKYNFSTAGVLLGLVLGPIAEDGMRNLLIISDDAPIGFIMGRPVSLVIILCIAVILSFSLLRKRKQEALLRAYPLNAHTHNM
ncbi:MAG: tripartite tricarboxylate transporter permease [Rhodospirillales bacterium]|jgi:putative tricarboxylic transport membrane protein|nr:C4-dicarboxylate ABC transporter permease [Rhodospirillaceae bacterium]MDP6429150.1 tripartite tricarboxylate transporter permease [Rhodospirillales bacterium]MDP6645666.1 tripartite tricarboxylate transporter permease [Rhodospirillales bacterium]